MAVFQLIMGRSRVTRSMCLMWVIPLVVFKYALMASITSNALRLIAFENSDIYTWFCIHTREYYNNGTCRDWLNAKALSIKCSNFLMQLIKKIEENIEISEFYVTRFSLHIWVIWKSVWILVYIRIKMW